MKKSFLLKLLMLALCASMVLALFACEGGNVETDPTPDEQTEGKTDPAETDPTESNPAESNPAESNPAESNPAESNPAESNPAESNPAETDPPAPTCDGNHELKAKGDIGHYYTVSCDICGIVKETIAPHTLEDKDGKPTCKDCGHVATCQGVHNYEYNDEGHWKNECLACGAKAVEIAAHEMDHVNGEYVCTVCGFKDTCNGQHELVSDGEAGHHEKACVICNTPDGATVEHTFEDKNGSRFCVCGYEAACKGVHQWTSDAEGHQEAACDVCGAVAGEKLPHSEEKAEFVDGNEYSYGCKDCGYGDITRTLEDSVKVFYSPYMISYTSLDHPTNPRTHYQFGTKAFVVDSDEAYFGFAGADKALQFIWNRGPGANGYKEGGNEDYTVDIGNANYLVIKMRVSETNLAKNFGISYSTTGVDSSKYVALPVASATANKWETYVIDLAKAYNGQHVLDAESGTYKVDTFYYHCDSLASTTKIDIAYMAFVEGDWADIGALVDEETVIAVTASNVGVKVDKTTGKCVGDHAYVVQSADGTNVLFQCAVCGNVKHDYKISTDAATKIWWAEDIAKSGWSGGANGATTKTITSDATGPQYLRISNYTAGSGLYWWPQNANITGQYLVLKVRIGDNAWNQEFLQLWALSAASKSAGTSYDKGASHIKVSDDGEWHTIVIDLAARVGETAFAAEEDGSYKIHTLHIRPFNNSSSAAATDWMDIAYIAVCDSAEDIADLVGGDSYEWSVSKTESEIRTVGE